MSYNYGHNPYYDNNDRFNDRFNAGRGGHQWGRGDYNRFPAPNQEDIGFRRGGRGGRRPPHHAPPSHAVVAPVPTTSMAPAPAPPAPGPVPGPKHLSKTASPLTNDPLYLESFIDVPGTELRRLPQLNEHRPTATALPQVVEEDFKAISSRSQPFAKNVSLSTYNDYVSLQVYARLLDVRRQNSESLTFEEGQFLDQISLNSLTISKTIELYLSGFGNTAIPGSSDTTFVFQKPDLIPAGGLPGFFSPLADNADEYHSYPAPGVAAQKVMEDIRVTALPNAPPAWQLLIDVEPTLVTPDVSRTFKHHTGDPNVRLEHSSTARRTIHGKQ